MRVEKEVVDHLDLAEKSLREAGGMMVLRLKVGVKEVGGHLDLAEEGPGETRMMVHRLKVGVEEVEGHLDLAGEAAKMISSAH
jgi:hypothetical protein